MNYPLDQCHFCNTSLCRDTRFDTGIFCCQNKGCKYNYYVEFRYNRTLVCFSIEKYMFTFLDSPNQTIIEKAAFYYKDRENYRIQEQMFITLDNYLQVVDRVKRLQVFK